MQKVDDIDIDATPAGQFAEDVHARHTNFLKKRGRSDGQAISFRPKKRHRASVVKALRLLDNQIRVGTNWQGLVYYSFDELSLKDPTKWQDEPAMSCASDMGGDMVSTAFACMYFPPVQVFPTPHPLPSSTSSLPLSSS